MFGVSEERKKKKLLCDDVMKWKIRKKKCTKIMKQVRFTPFISVWCASVEFIKGGIEEGYSMRSKIQFLFWQFDTFFCI